MVTVLTIHIRHLNFSSPTALLSVSSSRIRVFSASSTWFRVWTSLPAPATDPASSAVPVSVTSDCCRLELPHDMGSSLTSTSGALPLLCVAALLPSGLHPQEEMTRVTVQSLEWRTQICNSERVSSGLWHRGFGWPCYLHLQGEVKMEAAWSSVTLESYHIRRSQLESCA
jgi:hypothetical protein